MLCDYDDVYVLWYVWLMRWASAMYYSKLYVSVWFINDVLRSCVNLIKLLRVESMHLHNYETVELYAQSDGEALAQSDGEAY